MGILFQCPDCKKKHSLKSEKCSCGKSLKKLPNKHYWIDYRVHGKRVRESIGTSKLSAENRLREVKTAIVEDRYIKKDSGKSITLAEIYAWYMSLSEVIQLETYKTLKSRLGHTIRIIGSSVHVSSLSLDDIERYRRERSGDKSRWVKSGTIRSSTINKEISALKSMLNLAVNYKKIEKNPILKAKLLKVENVRERIISKEEFDALLDYAPRHLKSILIMAYYQPMRKEEIIGLTWDEVDLAEGIIKLMARRTKGKKEGRSIPIHPMVKQMLQKLPRPMHHTDRVFLYLDTEGKYRPFKWFQRSWANTLKRAGLKDIVFHDFRHTAITNLRKAGTHHSVIMKMSGHKTMSMFHRYNLVDHDDLKAVKWADETNDDSKSVLEAKK